MCKKHPTYKAIRKPKKLKATGEMCMDCWVMYMEKHHITPIGLGIIFTEDK